MVAAEEVRLPNKHAHRVDNAEVLFTVHAVMILLFLSYRQGN